MVPPSTPHLLTPSGSPVEEVPSLDREAFSKHGLSLVWAYFILQERGGWP